MSKIKCDGGYIKASILYYFVPPEIILPRDIKKKIVLSCILHNRLMWKLKHDSFLKKLRGFRWSIAIDKAKIENQKQPSSFVCKIKISCARNAFVILIAFTFIRRSRRVWD